MVAIVKSIWSKKDLMRSAGQRADRPKNKVAGSWISDLAALGKAICLCDLCAHKWKPKAYGYRRVKPVPSHNYVLGTCDGCKARAARCGLYLTEERSL